MKTITIRMDDALHKKLKLKMIHEDKTIQDYVIELITEDLNEPEKSE